MSRAKGMRRVRGMQAGIVVFEVGDCAFETFRGHAGFAFIPAACAVIIVLAMLWLTRKIRQREYLNRPRPDYSSIAAMERDIYGETFEHEGAPSRTARAAVIDSRPDRLPEGYSRCPRGHSYHDSHDSRPRCFECEDERHAERCPDTTAPASIDQYAAWLRGYVKRGGKPTHFYDHPFKDFRYASGSTLVIDSGYEFGARSREIIVARGVDTQRTNPAGLFDGWGHSSLYFMHGYRTNKPGFVPVYSDPEFDFARRETPETTGETT